MRRYRHFFLLVLTAAVIVLPASAQREDRHERDHDRDNDDVFQLNEATISQIQHAYHTHLLTPEQLVRMYLARIQAYDSAGPHLNSYMFVNPHALDAARQLGDDAEDGRHEGETGDYPLFGIPVIVKDNNDTADMPTTAGSVALGGSVPPDDATIIKKIRRAGGIILGKGTLTEFANFLTNGMPTGYSSQLRQQLINAGADPATAGYGFNPFDPRPDPRKGFNDGRPALATGGSSSGPGIAVSANLATIGIGTETSGSILSPGTMNLLVGIKPTLGLVSRDGIVPITADQDTAGPLARTVTDAAKLLGVIAGFDPKDPATYACLKPGNCFHDYTRFLDKDALRGAHIAVPHYGYWDNGNPDTTQPHFVVISKEQEQIMNDAIAVLRAQGATVTDFYEVPDESDLLKFGTCAQLPPLPANCTSVLLFGFKRDLNSYLASLGPSAPVHNMQDVFDFNNAHNSVALKYGQILVDAARRLDTTPGSADSNRYLSDRAKDLQLSRTDGLDKIYAAGFDAVLFPANRGANIAARAGYPSIVVPGGFYVNPPVAACLSDPTPCPFSAPTPFPDKFNALPAPYGVTFSGPSFSEPRLIALAYAFEQATHHRVAPPSVPALPSDTVSRK